MLAVTLGRLLGKAEHWTTEKKIDKPTDELHKKTRMKQYNRERLKMC